jgi:hypothetical protein
MAEEETHEENHETPPVPHHEEPPAHVPPHDDTHDRLNALTTTVNEMKEVLDSVVNKGEPDSTPVRRPWTHYGSH